ncbi:Imm49 family immunity protein [Pyxidicoccus sp. 3LG]
MTSEFLPVFVRNALASSRMLLPRLQQGAASLEDTLACCQHLRIAGIGAFFLTGDPGALHGPLAQSGQAFATFLGQAEDGVKRTSRSLPFFDALAAGDDTTAATEARLSRHTWAEGEEYEEDFLFVEFLMQSFFLGASRETGERLLGRYEQVLQGAEDIRLPLCRALFERDSAEFDTALSTFLAERADGYEQRSEGEPPEVLATEALLSVEGLGLVRLAERWGLQVEEDYLHVPSLARAP